MKTKVEVITPEYATEVLDKHNPRNRRISEPTVQSYAADMRAGRWTLTHQGIAFDDKGNLIDGQHRLWAIVFANKEIELMVTRGIPESEVKNGIELRPMDNIDAGRARTMGQRFGLSHNVKNGTQVAAAIKSIACIIYPSKGSNRMSSAQSLFIYELYGPNIEAVIDGMDAKKRLGYLLGPLAIYHMFDSTKAIEFRNQFSTLENLSDQVRVFVRWLDVSRGKVQQESVSRALALTIQAYHNGDPLKRIVDGDAGRLFLNNMNPNVTKRIRESLKPINKKLVLQIK